MGLHSQHSRSVRECMTFIPENTCYLEHFLKGKRGGNVTFSHSPSFLSDASKTHGTFFILEVLTLLFPQNKVKYVLMLAPRC